MKQLFIYYLLMLVITACQEQASAPLASIEAINLKKGTIISCSPDGLKLGSTAFRFECTEQAKDDFLLGVKLLHSFEYDEAEKAFASVIDKDPNCAMAYWGVAMANFHPLWTPPSTQELEKGNQALSIARSLPASKEAAAYIEAIGKYYDDWQHADHRTRTMRFEMAMEKIYKENPKDVEAAVFYALSLNAAADPQDKSFTKQKQAGDILQSLAPGQPDHPGIAHYLIHTYDYPELAHLGLPAARKYATVAPSSAHAMHMPSHIFTQLGYWDECIQSNQASVAAAQCYAASAGIKGHWDEELHGLDYLVYAYLQKGENDSAKKQWDYLKTMKEIHPLNFKVAYAFAAIPSRYVIENKFWQQASSLALPSQIPWQEYPWQAAIVHFTRLLGAVHTNQLASAEAEHAKLKSLHDTLTRQKDSYKAGQVAIQLKAGEAWILWKKGRTKEAIATMHAAADMEDRTGKHPVTPGEVIPAREQLADLYLYTKQPLQALATFEEALKKHPNRFNALYGAATAAAQSGNQAKAELYFKQLKQIAGETSTRPELKKDSKFLLAYN